MAANEKHPLIETLTVQLGPSATNVSTSVAFRAPFAGTITGITYSPLASVTGQNTNTRTLRFQNHRLDGSGTTVIASLPVVSGVNLTAFDERTVPLSATAADLVVAASDVIEMQSLSVGSGIAGPGGTAYVTFSRE